MIIIKYPDPIQNFISSEKGKILYHVGDTSFSPNSKLAQFTEILCEGLRVVCLS